MVKNWYLGLLILFIFGIVSCASTKNVEHPLTYNIDINDYTEDFVIKPNKEKTELSYKMDKIKIKTELLSGDTLCVYLAFSSKYKISYLFCELTDGEGTVIDKVKMENTRRKEKKFISSATFKLSEDLVNPVYIRIISDGEILKKKTKVELIDLKIKKFGDEAYKKYERKQLPKYIEDIIEENSENSASWYISKVMDKQKAGSKVFGPFNNKQQVLAIWAFKNFKSKNYYCIAKNYSYITDSPENYFAEYQEVLDCLQENGSEAALEYYFLDYEE